MTYDDLLVLLLTVGVMFLILAPSFVYSAKFRLLDYLEARAAGLPDGDYGGFSVRTTGTFKPGWAEMWGASVAESKVLSVGGREWLNADDFSIFRVPAALRALRLAGV